MLLFLTLCSWLVGRLSSGAEVRSHDSLRVYLNGGRSPSSPGVLAKGIYVPLPGQQESQEIDAPVATGLTNAEKHQVVS